jgi:hypothetical protein
MQVNIIPADLADVISVFLWTVAPAAASWLIWKMFWPDGGKKRKAKAQLDGHAAMVELEKLRIAERREIRAQAERLALEKLDILRTAVAMGYSQQQLAELDARLAEHIGADGLQQLDGPLPPADLPALDAAPAGQPAAAAARGAH